MRQVHCDGCGFSESTDLPQSKRKIQETSFIMVNDPRFPEGTDKFEADLCPTCISLLLHSYFNVPAEGRLKLDLPAFLVPEELGVIHAGGGNAQGEK